MPKLSIGICALNEAGNIRRLLDALGEQQKNGFEVVEIIVNSDGSTDATVNEALASTAKMVHVWEQTERKGKSYRQQEIFSKFSGDMLLMLDADILPCDSTFIAKLVRPMLVTNNTVGLISCPLRAMPGLTIVEHIINYSLDLKEELLRHNNNSDNIYACHGPVRLFSRKLIEAYNIKDIVSEDAYSYLLCKQLGLKFVYISEIFVWFRSPQTISDYIKQSVRFQLGKVGLKKYVVGSVIEEAHFIPLAVKLSVTFKYVIKQPGYFIAYIIMLLVSKIASFLYLNQTVDWKVAASSKRL